MKRILIRIGGVILLIFSGVAIMFSGSFFWGDLHPMQFLLIPLLFISGMALSSYKKWAQKLAIFSYVLVLLINLWPAGPQVFIFTLISLFFIIVLICSGEEFKE